MQTTYEITVKVGSGMFEKVIIKAQNLQIARKMAEAQTGGQAMSSKVIPR